ncbi:hypothetical protein ACFVAJ_17600 [Agromyces sp. NPDC057679]|uniref:hypothetical protein n=1 Tax=Agromyces sp. NPDC057679 TaxID=3346207 RepID=UPI00366F4DF6
MTVIATTRQNPLIGLFLEKSGKVRVRDLHDFTDDWVNQLARHWQGLLTPGDGILLPGRVDRQKVLRTRPVTADVSAATGVDAGFWDIQDALDREDVSRRATLVLDAATVVAGFQAALPARS